MERLQEENLNADKILRDFIESEAESLLPTLCVYVKKSGLVSKYDEVSTVALEILNETFIEMLKTSVHFDTSRSPKPWLLRIAANLISRRQKKEFNRSKNEILDEYSESDFFDHIGAISNADPYEIIDMRDQVSSVLQQLQDNDRKTLELAIEHGVSGKAIARELGIAPGTARVRLHRALKRAKEVLESQQRKASSDSLEKRGRS